jgi:hypothetical protein
MCVRIYVLMCVCTYDHITFEQWVRYSLRALVFVFIGTLIFEEAAFTLVSCSA